MTGLALIASVILLAVVVGILLLGAVSRLLAGESEPVNLADHPPIEGRFCPQPGCGGLLAYRRAKAGDGFATYLACWKCGARWLIHDEPDFANGARKPDREIERERDR